MPLPVFRTTIQADWIDYNGHLRDAYYTLIMSAAIDALMDELGLDAAYRARTGSTLYTLETHIHYLRELKQSDEPSVTLGVINSDHKRILAGLVLNCPRLTSPAAAAEFMLLHVHQGDEVKSAKFPPDIQSRVDVLKSLSQAEFKFEYPSRKLQLI